MRFLELESPKKWTDLQYWHPAVLWDEFQVKISPQLFVVLPEETLVVSVEKQYNIGQQWNGSFKEAIFLYNHVFIC